jgi:hypothetical protein
MLASQFWQSLVHWDRKGVNRTAIDVLSLARYIEADVTAVLADFQYLTRARKIGNDHLATGSSNGVVCVQKGNGAGCFHPGFIDSKHLMAGA